MSEYVRYVSVYTGPSMYKDVGMEYEIAARRLLDHKNAVIHKDEDIREENAYVRDTQLPSHLLFKVIVNEQDLPDDTILDIASFVAWITVSPVWVEGRKASRLWRWMGNELPYYPHTKYLHCVDFKNHPNFEHNSSLLAPIRPRQWTPAAVDAQFLEFPESNAEDEDSRKKRQARYDAWNSADVTFHTSSSGITEICVSQEENVKCYFPTPPRPVWFVGEIIDDYRINY